MIVVTGGDRAGAVGSTTITTDRTWTIGRSADCDVVVDDGRVSRRHLVVESTGPMWVIRDVSANGTWTAGVRLGPAGVAIPDNAELRLNLGDPAGPVIVVAGGPPTRPLVGPALADLATVVPGPAGPARPAAARPAPPAGSAAVPPGPAAMPTGRRVRRRRTRWLVGGVIALAVLLVVADRLAAAAASTEAVQQVVAQSQGLGSTPTVSFGGIPFLTQVAFGKYTDIAVGINGITPPGGPRVEHLSAHLKGAHIPLSKVVHNSVKTIPVDHVTATLTIAFSDLNAFLRDQPGQLVLSAGKDGAVQVSGQLTEDGSVIMIAGSARLQSDDGQLTRRTGRPAGQRHRLR